jgi:hypothetical protein
MADEDVTPAPEQSQIEDAIEIADGKLGSRDSKPRRTGHAQAIFTQQLIHDIQIHTRATKELEETVSTYAFWSRLLTIVLIFLSTVLVVQNYLSII